MANIERNLEVIRESVQVSNPKVQNREVLRETILVASPKAQHRQCFRETILRRAPTINQTITVFAVT
jgi:hypothetical protein